MSKMFVDSIQSAADGTLPAVTLAEAFAKLQWHYDQIEPAVLSSLNVSSITDSAAGNHILGYTNAFSALEYSFHLMGASPASVYRVFATTTPTTSSVQMVSEDDASADTDGDGVTGQLTGVLA